MSGAGPLCSTATPKRTAAMSSQGWWVDGERGRKELKPWGLHCCSGGDYDWQANSFHSFSFFSSSPPSFFCTKFTEWFRPGRDALKVPRLVITLASRLLFKYRAFSYDLVDCVVKVEVVVAIARHFLSLFFQGDVLPSLPLDARFLAVSKAPRPNERYLMLSRRSFLGDCLRLFRIFFKICLADWWYCFSWIFRKSGRIH